MSKKFVLFSLILLGVFLSSSSAFSRELAGVTFEEEKMVAGKELKLNGVAIRKALGFIKVFAGGLYLENPSKNAQEIIESEQVKHFFIHYLTSKATAKKIQDGFIEGMTKANPPELVTKHMELIKQYAGWLDVDMKPGYVSESVYIPGKGITVTVQGIEKGTIQDVEFVQMYYRYYLGDKADSKIRDGFLGL